MELLVFTVRLEVTADWITIVKTILILTLLLA